MTVSITPSLLLFIILQGSILSITCFSFPQFQQIRMDFWYLWNLTYQIDENSAAENIQYMNLIHHKSKLKREFIPNSESLCGREASFGHTSMISLFACRKDTIKYNSLLLGLQHLFSSSLPISFPKTQASLYFVCSCDVYQV